MSKKDMLGVSALAVVAGPLKDFAEKLSGADGSQWLEAFKRFLRKEEAWPKILIWKTIKLGTGPKTANDFRKALQDGGFLLGEWANDILGKTTFKAAKKKTEIDLVVISVAELGFKNGATLQDIYQRAQELGFDICPPEVGPQLRLQYKDQPNGEWLPIGMEPVVVSNGPLRVFSVGRDDSGLWFDGHWGHPGAFWDPDDRWVFARPRK